MRSDDRQMRGIAGCRATEFFVANAPSAFSEVERHLDLPYGNDPRQQLDIIAPRRGENLPVVVFWYGGSWIARRKSEYRFVGDTLAKRGIVTVLADYRLYPQVTFRSLTKMARRLSLGSSITCVNTAAIRNTSS